MKWLVSFTLIALLLASGSGIAGGQSPQEHASRPQQAEAGDQSQQVPEALLTNGTVERVPPKPGEVCTVCDKRVESSDLVYMVDGQRVPVHAGDCDTVLRARPQKWLARVKPKGGAFLGTDVHLGLTNAWLYAGLYVLVGLIFAALSAQRALRAGYSPLTALMLGLAFNVLGYLFVLARPKRVVEMPAGVPGGLHKIPTTYEPQPCPACGGENHPSATRCLSCGSPLAARIGSEVEKAGLRT